MLQVIISYFDFISMSKIHLYKLLIHWNVFLCIRVENSVSHIQWMDGGLVWSYLPQPGLPTQVKHPFASPLEHLHTCKLSRAPLSPARIALLLHFLRENYSSSTSELKARLLLLEGCLASLLF